MKYFVAESGVITGIFDEEYAVDARSVTSIRLETRRTRNLPYTSLPVAHFWTETSAHCFGGVVQIRSPWQVYQEVGERAWHP